MHSTLSRRQAALGLAAAACAPGLAFAQDEQTYSEDEVRAAADRFFGSGAEGLATVVAHIFAEQGRPNGYIQGQEGSGAAVVGLRYGQGDLHLKHRSDTTHVYWQGPTVGFDTGGNAAKVFTLIYHMREPSQIFARYPGVDGSAYFVGGVGANYQRRNGITLAPIRFGVGLRLGANVGYLHYSRRRRVNPF